MTGLPDDRRKGNEIAGPTVQRLAGAMFAGLMVLAVVVSVVADSAVARQQPAATRNGDKQSAEKAERTSSVSGNEGQPSPGTKRWSMPEPSAVRQTVLEWLEQKGVDGATRRAAEAIWAEGTGTVATTDTRTLDVLEATARTVALVDHRAGQLVRWCQSGSELVGPKTEWLVAAENDLPKPIAGSLRLYVARVMVHRRLHDEAVRMLEGLEPEDVFDPASLLFYRAAAYHQLVRPQEALQAAEQLLAAEEHVPRRFTAVARLMKADLESLKKGSLDQIARWMNNSGRYLDLGRADRRVQQLQQDIVDALDKLIEQLEQAGQQQQAASSSGSMQQPTRPAEESRILGGRGPGHVTRRPIGNTSGWGNLPPKQREEALQQIGRRFPAHYREVIEQYFRRLAAEEMP